MALPATIPTNFTRFDKRATGIFKSSGGDIYVAAGDSVGVTLVVSKSSNPDTTNFTEQDATNAPVADAANGILNFIQDGDLIHCLSKHNATTQGVFYARFNMANDTWVDLGGGNRFITIADPSTAYSDPQASLIMRGDGDLICAYEGDLEMDMGGSYSRSYYKNSADDGATWGSEVAIHDTATVASDPKNSYRASSSIILDASDRVYMPVEHFESAVVWLRVLKSDDTLVSWPTSGSLTTSQVNINKFGAFVEYDDGGTNRVRVTNRVTDVLCVSWDAADAPTMSVATVESGGIGGIAMIETATAKELMILYVDSSVNKDIYSEKNLDDGGWGSRTLEDNTATATQEYLRGGVKISRSGTKYAYFYATPGVDSASYDEIDIAAAAVDLGFRNLLLLGVG
jgi:hypothetical protein